MTVTAVNRLVLQYSSTRPTYCTLVVAKTRNRS